VQSVTVPVDPIEAARVYQKFNVGGRLSSIAQSKPDSAGALRNRKAICSNALAISFRRLADFGNQNVTALDANGVTDSFPRIAAAGRGSNSLESPFG
jgi:hypothetical protein